ncbi:MAG: hypothetical protein ISEC1_P0196 [Thiomicrorhabdus sp.]|nr:MAG: hypothetical protein ISEC1_P0196 [Thiomicrorhabdus sp.]
MGNVLHLEPRTAAHLVSRNNKSITISQDKAEVFQFTPKQVDMMPGNWASSGNPTAYELRTTLHTCKRMLQMNYDALNYLDCDREVTLENINVLEKLYIILMDYLVD